MLRVCGLHRQSESKAEDDMLTRCPPALLPAPAVSLLEAAAGCSRCLARLVMRSAPLIPCPCCRTYSRRPRLSLIVPVCPLFRTLQIAAQLLPHAAPAGTFLQLDESTRSQGSAFHSPLHKLEIVPRIALSHGSLRQPDSHPDPLSLQPCPGSTLRISLQWAVSQRAGTAAEQANRPRVSSGGMCSSDGGCALACLPLQPGAAVSLGCRSWRTWAPRRLGAVLAHGGWGLAPTPTELAGSPAGSEGPLERRMQPGEAPGALDPAAGLAAGRATACRRPRRRRCYTAHNQTPHHASCLLNPTPCRL